MFGTTLSGALPNCTAWPSSMAICLHNVAVHGVTMRATLRSMVVEMVPLKGGLGGIVHPPIGSIYHLYTTYILPSGGLYAT